MNVSNSLSIFFLFWVIVYFRSTRQNKSNDNSNNSNNEPK